MKGLIDEQPLISLLFNGHKAAVTHDHVLEIGCTKLCLTTPCCMPSNLVTTIK